MSESEAASSTSNNDQILETESVEKRDEFAEPDAKKRKVSNNKCGDDKKCNLEDRLGGILCCAVCLDLPRAAVYQVSYSSKCYFRVIPYLINGNFIKMLCNV